MILGSPGEGCGSDEGGHEAEGVPELLERGHGMRKAVSSWPRKTERRGSLKLWKPP